MARQLSIIIGIVISLGLLVYLLSEVSIPRVLEIASSFNALLLIPICIIVYVSYLTRALRWSLLLGKFGGRETVFRYNRALIIGTFASTVLPLRAGEFVRPWVISRTGRISFGVLFSSVVLERVFDVFGMLFFLGISLRALPDAGSWITYSANTLILITAVICFGAIFCVFFGSIARRLCLWIICLGLGTGHRARRVARFGYEIITGFSNLRSISQLAKILLLTLILWFQYSLTFYLGLVGFRIHADLGVANLLNSMVALAVAMPSAPGFIGTYQFGCVTALTQYPYYTKDFAVAFSLFFHAIHLTFTVVAGLICLYREDLTFASMLKRGSEPTTELNADLAEKVFPA